MRPPEVKAEAVIRSTSLTYRQNHVISFANISIQCERLKRWTCVLLIHNLDDCQFRDQSEARKRPLSHFPRLKLRPAGVEPTTFGFGGRPSIQLSYGRVTELQPVYGFAPTGKDEVAIFVFRDPGIGNPGAVADARPLQRCS